MSAPGSKDGSKRNSTELDSEHAQRAVEAEHQHQHQHQQPVRMKDRQRFFEEAYQQDVEQYLSTGLLQITERREPIGSMSSMEVNVDMLEQMELIDVSDHEPLDVFLNSGGEDNSVASPMLDPDTDSSFTTEITLQVPTQAELRHKLSSLSSTCTDSASQDNDEDDDVVEDDEDDEDEDEDEEEEEEELQGAAASSLGATRRAARGRGRGTGMGNRSVGVATTGSSSSSSSSSSSGGGQVVMKSSGGGGGGEKDNTKAT
ncbi:dystrobrevin binding protein 1b [Engraulis encrasicolus]|uniref:dystrobrevin binding protein 1b n=1 Tax=Engraulis encrasicolus TaxID=184585 RepID=UPI002FD22315